MFPFIFDFYITADTFNNRLAKIFELRMIHEANYKSLMGDYCYRPVRLSGMIEDTVRQDHCD